MGSLRKILAVSGGFLLSASPVLAEDAQGVGLPQLDISLYPEQLFWLAVCFAILYVLMWRIALPGVTRTQDNRQKVISAEVAAAKAASETAKATAEKMEKSLAAARTAAQAKVSELIAHVSEERAAKQLAQEKEISRKLHAAEAQISVAREAALKAVRGSADELAAAMTEKVMGKVA